MKLPWVSRARHDELRGALTEQLRRAHDDMRIYRDDVAYARELHHNLFARYHMLKLQGFAEPAATTPRAERDPIAAAINTKAGSNAALRSAMTLQANVDRTKGDPDDVIINRILSGVSVEEGFV